MSEDSPAVPFLMTKWQEAMASYASTREGQDFVSDAAAQAAARQDFSGEALMRSIAKKGSIIKESNRAAAEMLKQGRDPGRIYTTDGNLETEAQDAYARALSRIDERIMRMRSAAADYEDDPASGQWFQHRAEALKSIRNWMKGSMETADDQVLGILNVSATLAGVKQGGPERPAQIPESVWGQAMLEASSRCDYGDF